MAISYDSGGSASVASGTSISWTHTISGNNPIIMVGLNSSRTNGTFIGTPKYSGVDMIKIGSALASADTTELYYLNSPATGLGTIVGTSSLSGEILGFSMSFNNVDQTSQAIIGSFSNFNTGTNITTVTRNTTPQGMFIGFDGIRTSPGTTRTTNGQIEAGQIFSGTSNLMASYEQPTAVGNGSLVWTFPAGTFAVVTAELRQGVGSIAFDAAGSTTASSGSTFSFAHTCTGANGLLVLHFFNSGTSHISSVTYANQAMTSIISGTKGLTQEAELWYLVNPPTGLGTINGTVNKNSGLNNAAAVSTSFTGVDQTTPIGGSNVTIGTSVSAGTVTLATTVDTSWLVGGLGMSDQPGTSVTTTGQVLRGFGTSSFAGYYAVTNGPISPTATGTIQFTTPTLDNNVMPIAEIRPSPAAAPGGATNQTFKTLTGVGNI